MLSPSPAVRIFLGLEPVDMHGSHNALSGVVRRLGLDPLDGHVYVFVNRRRFMAALLWYDDSGWCVLKRRLSKGTFQVLDAKSGERQLQIDSATLTALLQGVELRDPRWRWYRRGAPERPCRSPTLLPESLDCEGMI